MKPLVVFCAVISFMTLSPPAKADLVLNFNDTFSGTAPSGSAPWLTATFHTVSTGTVTLMLTATNLTSSEFVSEFYFNVNPALGNPSPSMAFSQNSGVGYQLLHWGTDCCKANGDGEYDVEIDFPTSNGSRFGQGASAAFTITFTGLTENSFDFLSTPAGGSGPFTAAAHVQGIGTDRVSGWIDPQAIPEPSAILLLIGVAAGIGLRARRH